MRKSSQYFLRILFVGTTGCGLLGCAPSRVYDSNIAYYSSPKLCETHRISELSKAMESHNIIVKGIPSAPKEVNGKTYWSCGIALDWKSKPEKFSECQEAEHAAMTTLEEALMLLPENERPQNIISDRLHCMEAWDKAVEDAVKKK